MIQVLLNEIYKINIGGDIGIFKCRCYLPPSFQYEFESIGEIQWKVLIPVEEIERGTINIVHLENLRQLLE